MTYYKYDFYQYIAPHVHGVSQPIVMNVVEDVVRDFCQKTSFYRQWLENQISVGIDDEEVELDIPRYTAVVEVMAIQKVDDNGGYDEFLNPETYTYSNQDGLPKILFKDPSEEEYDARVRVALSPEVGFTIVPDWVWEDWRDVIVHGSLARLLSMRARAWYALAESEQHRSLYSEGVHKASRMVVLETLNKINKPISRYI